MKTINLYYDVKHIDLELGDEREFILKDDDSVIEFYKMFLLNTRLDQDFLDTIIENKLYLSFTSFDGDVTTGNYETIPLIDFVTATSILPILEKEIVFDSSDFNSYMLAK